MSQSPMPSPMPGAPQPSSGTSLTPVDPMRVLKQYKWLLIGTAVVGLIIGVGVYYLLVNFAPEYTSTPAVLVLNTEPANPAAEGDGRGDVRAMEQRKLTYAAQILAPDVLSNALRGPVTANAPDIRQTQWYNSFPGGPSREDLRRALSVRPPADTLLINVTATTSVRDDAPILANAVVQWFLESVTSDTRLDRDADRQALVRERARLERQMSDIEQDMSNIMSEEGLAAQNNRFHEIDATYQTLIAHRLEIARRITEAQQYHAGLQERQAAEDVEITPEDEAIIEQDPKLGGIDNRILALQQERRVMLEQYGPDHRAVKLLEDRLASARVERESEWQRLMGLRRDVKLAQLDAQVAGAAGAIAAAQGEYAEVSERINELQQRRAELEQRRAQHTALAAELDRIRAEKQRYDVFIRNKILESEGAAANEIDIAQLASTPEGLSFPPRVFVTAPGVAFLLTAFVAGLVFLKEMLDTRVKSPACAKLLPKVDLLGVIPDADEDPSGAQSIDMVVARDPSGLLAESFRQLRTEVLARMDAKGFKTLMVASSQSDGGASTVASNLAVSLAYNGRKVLIIDANFRRPVQHRYFGLEPKPGFAEYLHNYQSVDSVVQATNIENLDLLAIGDADDHILERIESNGFSKAMTELKQKYDLVLIDTPPMAIVGDSRQIANRVDASLLVVRAIQEKRGLVSRIINQLKQADGELIGVALNGVRSSAGGYFRRNYREFYDYQQKPGTRRRAAAGQTTTTTGS